MGVLLFLFLISLAVLLVAMLILNTAIPWTIIFLPLIILPLLFAIVGFAWFLAAMGVYVRDVSQTVGIITTVMMFLAPVFYPISALPEKWRRRRGREPRAGIME